MEGGSIIKFCECGSEVKGRGKCKVCDFKIKNELLSAPSGWTMEEIIYLLTYLLSDLSDLFDYIIHFLERSK